MRPQFTPEEFEALTKEADKYPPYSARRLEVFLRADLGKVFGDYPSEPLPLSEIFEETK